MINEKQMLQNLSVYVFDRKAAETRDVLHETIVETIFYLKGKSLDNKAVRHEIERELGFSLDQSIIDGAINRLTEKEFLKEDKQQVRFYLSAFRRRRVNEIVNKRKMALKNIENRLVSTYRQSAKHSTKEQEKMVLEYFYQFCVKLFSSNAYLLIGIMRCTDKEIEFIKRYKHPEKLIEETLEKVSDKRIKKALRETIGSVLADERILQSLATVARNYLYFQILNLDPQCKALQKEIFSRKMLLLDTNFIMSLVIPQRITHKAAVQCANLSTKLGVDMRFTPSTIQEFLMQLDHSHYLLRKTGITRLDVLSALDDDFIAFYSTEKRKRRQTTWFEVYNRFKGIKGTLSKFGISEYTSIEADFEIAGMDSKGEVTGHVMTCALGLAGNVKNTSVAEHDSHHLLLIRKLRERETPDALGPRFYFLTFDKTLLCVDKAINRIIGREKELPSSIECWAWTEMMMPFLSGEVSQDTAHEAFSQLMKTRFSILPAKLSTVKLVDIHTPKVDFNRYTTEEIKAILDDKFVTEYWRKMKEAIQTHSPKVKEYKRKLHERVETVANAIDYRKARVEIRTRYVSVIASIFMAVLCTYCVVVEKYLGAVILAILAVIFMAMALEYRKFELSYKKIKLLFSK